MKIKRWIGVLLFALLCVGMLPMTAFAATATQIVVNGTEILTAKDNTVQCGDGTAVYDSVNNTLTLTNAALDKEYITGSIFANGDLTIKLVGNNTITSPTTYGFQITGGSVTITSDDGSGSLTVNKPVLVSNGNMIVDNCTLNVTSSQLTAVNALQQDTSNECSIIIRNKANVAATGGAAGIWATTDISVSDSRVTVFAASETANEYGFYAGGKISFDNSTVQAETPKDGKSYAINGNTIEITNGSNITASANTFGMYARNTLSIDGSAVNASAASGNAISAAQSVNVENNSFVKAQGGNGMKGMGGATEISDSWLETSGSGDAITVGNNSVVIKGDSGTVNGNAVLKRDTELNSGITLTIPEGASITVDEGTTFRNNGTIILNGRFENNGTVICADSSHAGGVATCTSEAVCGICGQPYGSVNPDNHTNLVKIDANPATHTTEGNIEYWYCDGCDKYFSDEAGTKEIALANTVIPKLAEHTVDGTGWHSDETNHWNTCECGEKLNEAAHTFEWVTDKEATATEAGSKHEECTVCGYEKAAVEISATGTTKDPSELPADTDKPSDDQTGDTTSPQTGDDSNIALWIAVLFAAGAVLTGAGIYSRKRTYSR